MRVNSRHFSLTPAETGSKGEPLIRSLTSPVASIAHPRLVSVISVIDRTHLKQTCRSVLEFCCPLDAVPARVADDTGWEGSRFEKGPALRVDLL